MYIYIYIYIYKTRAKWLPLVRERVLYKKWLHLNLNNGFH